MIDLDEARQLLNDANARGRELARDRLLILRGLDDCRRLVCLSRQRILGSVRQLAGAPLTEVTEIERVEMELTEARRYVREAEALVARQQRVVAGLPKRSQSAALAGELLATFDANLLAFRDHLRRVAEERGACAPH